MIQLLQLLQYYPVPMSISNIGDSPVFQGLDHFKKHLIIFFGHSSLRLSESRISFVLVSLKRLSLGSWVSSRGSCRRSFSWPSPWWSRGTGRTPRRPSGHRTSRRRPSTRPAAPWSHLACSGPQGIAPSWKSFYVKIMPNKKALVMFTYWKPDFSLPDMLPKYSGSLITSQINFFWHSRSL